LTQPTRYDSPVIPVFEQFRASRMLDRCGLPAVESYFRKLQSIIWSIYSSLYMGPKFHYCVRILSQNNSAHTLTPKHTIYQYSDTIVMHFLFSLLRFNGLYMFRTLLAHPQKAPHKRHLVYCVRVISSATPGPAN
jgi:hypothetical protein